MAKFFYGDAVKDWGKICPAADGANQSPVDIKGAVKSDMPALAFDMKSEGSVNLSNVGWTLVAGCSAGSSVTGGPFGGNYKLASFHFHWGSSDAAGSEHKVAGKQYPAECHIVFYNADKYGSYADASKSADGLGIVAVLCNVGGDCGAKGVFDNAGKAADFGSKAGGGAVDPKCLLPGNTKDFWAYHGSLTCPPCSENVEWVVMKDPITVSSAQLAAMRGIKDFDGNALVQNFRGCCDVGGRTIKSSF